MFEEIPHLMGFEDLKILENKEKVMNTAVNLQRKQYLLANNQKQYWLDMDLKNLLKRNKHPNFGRYGMLISLYDYQNMTEPQK